MSEPTLSLTFADLYADVSEFMGYGRSPGGDNATKVKSRTNDGLRRYYAGQDPRGGTYSWSHLSPHATLDLWASATGKTPTGLVGTTDGAGNSATIVGVSTATFFASMVGHRLKFSGGSLVHTGGSFLIISYTSGKTITVLKDATGHTASGSSITANGIYALPDDFAYMVDNPSYGASETPGFLTNRSVSWIRRQMSGEGTVTGYPSSYAVAPRTFTNTTGQRYDLLVHPISGGDYEVEYRYRVNPDKLTGDTTYPYGGALHADTIRKCCMAAAEQWMEDKVPYWQPLADAAMANSIDADARNKPRNLGVNLDHSDEAGPIHNRRSTVTYS